MPNRGAEFYAGTGDDPCRAYELASVNLSNQPTLQAFEQAYATALDAGKTQAASEILTTAAKYWGEITAFGRSPLAGFA